MDKNGRHPSQNTVLEKLRTVVAKESSDGAALLDDLEGNPICSIGVDKSVPCVSVTWKRYATGAQLRFIHENIIHLLKKHGLTKVLGDDTALSAIHMEDQSWIIENWFPRALETGLRIVASKNPLSHFGKVSVENIKSGMAADVFIRSFNDIAEARSWLQSATCSD